MELTPVYAAASRGTGQGSYRETAAHIADIEAPEWDAQEQSREVPLEDDYR
jgi:hypothetical protein